MGRAPSATLVPDRGPGAGTRRGWELGAQAGLSLHPSNRFRLCPALQHSGRMGVQSRGGAQQSPYQGRGFCLPLPLSTSWSSGVAASLHPASTAPLLHSPNCSSLNPTALYSESHVPAPCSPVSPHPAALSGHILLPVVPHPATLSTHILLPVFPHPASYGRASRILQPCIPISCIPAAAYPTALHLCIPQLFPCISCVCSSVSSHPTTHSPIFPHPNPTSHSPVVLHPTALDPAALHPYSPCPHTPTSLQPTANIPSSHLPTARIPQPFNLAAPSTPPF